MNHKLQVGGSNPPAPTKTMKKYNIILADPPWFYNKRSNPKTKFGLGLYGSYLPMKTEEIAQLPVPDIADTNCALHLWATSPRLPDAVRVLSGWGFRYCTVVYCWVKTTLDGQSFRANPGHYSLSNVEHVLLGIRGKMPPQTLGIRQIVAEPPREHSRKPDCVRDRIVSMFGDLPRVEMFARERTNGWDCHGDQVESPELVL